MKKKAISFVIAALMACSAVPAVAAAETETKTIATETKQTIAEKKALTVYSDHLTGETAYDITGSSIAWVKQGNGALVWVPATDSRSDEAIVAQAKSADSSLTGGTSEFAVMKGIGTAKTPNTHGSQAEVTVSEADGKLTLSIEGKYSHCVKALADVEPVVPEETVAPEEPTAPAEPVVEVEKVSIRIDAPKKMAVAFEDGTVCYGGEMKEFEVDKEYRFQMCSVNWDNGIFDGADNGIRGTVVYRMIAVHQKKFLELSAHAKEEPERYTVKGIDIIDNVDKIIIVNCDAKDTHLETDVNNFFMAYRFHGDIDYKTNLKTGIEKVINTPVESLSVNLPLGSTIACKAYNGDEVVDKADVLVTNNSGTGIYYNQELSSVNDFKWGQQPAVIDIPEPVYYK